MKVIHIARNGTQLGEFKENELAAALASGHVVLNDLAWVDGQKEWQDLSSLMVKLQMTTSVPPSLPSSKLTAKNKAIQLGQVSISNIGSVSGNVKNSRHDRVGDVSGEGKSESGGSFSTYRGTGYGNVSSSMRFSISTRIDTRHEFWVNDNGHEIQYVFPISMPIADGQNVTVTQLSLSRNEDDELLAFVFDNNSSKKSFLYIPENNNLTELESKQELVKILSAPIFAKAYETDDKFLEYHPEVKSEWDQIKVETAPHQTLVNLKLAMLAIRFSPAIFILMFNWGAGIIKNIPILVVGLIVGKFLEYICVVFISKLTGMGRIGINNAKNKEMLISGFYQSELDSKLISLIQAG